MHDPGSARRPGFLAALAAAALLGGSPSLAETYSGRLTSTVYVFQRADSTDGETTHARGTQIFQLARNGRDVTLRTYGQVDGDLASRLVGDPKLRLYDLSLEWHDVLPGASIRLGRQPVFAGAASGTIDGARVDVQPVPPLRLRGFAGGLPPAEHEATLTDELGDNWMLGGQLAVRPTADSRIALAYVAKRRRRPGFDALRADTLGNVFTRFVEPDDRELEIASVDAAWTVARATLRGRGDYDHLGRRLTRAELSARADVSSRWTLNGGYTYRSPRLPWSSIFSVFNVDDNHEIEGGVGFRLLPEVRMHGAGAVVLYADESSYRATVGVDTRLGGGSWVRRGGWAGELDGFNLFVQHPLGAGKITPLAQLSWARYRTDSDRGGRETVFSGVGGLTVHARADLSLDGQVQFLRNPRYEQDVRFLLRLRYRFFVRPGAGERSGE